MDMIAAACENAEKVLADTRKAYGFGTRQGPSMISTMDKGQTAKIHEHENMLRAAVNDGAGKNALPVASNNINGQGNLLQASGARFMGRSTASPFGANFDNTRSPLPYSNSPQSTAFCEAKNIW